MNRPRNEVDPMTDQIDRLLDEHLGGPAEQLTPSSGFAVSVMESIEAKAAEPPPIAFPWGRVLPGMMAILCGLVALAVLAFRSLHSQSSVETARQFHMPTLSSIGSAFTSGEVLLGWAALATCLSIAAVAASLRLAGRGE